MSDFNLGFINPHDPKLGLSVVVDLEPTIFPKGEIDSFKGNPKNVRSDIWYRDGPFTRKRLPKNTVYHYTSGIGSVFQLNEEQGHQSLIWYLRMKGPDTFDRVANFTSYMYWNDDLRMTTIVDSCENCDRVWAFDFAPFGRHDYIGTFIPELTRERIEMQRCAATMSLIDT